jgi:hypothetical protein
MNETATILPLALRLSALGVLSLIVACDPFNSNKAHPADAKLLQRFQKNEAAFNKLVQMSNQDSNVIRIAYDFTRLETNWAWPRPESLLGFPRERWDQYRKFFNKLNLPSGLDRANERPSPLILLHASSKGMTFRGSSKGFAYCEHPLSPLRDSLDQHDSQNPQKHGIVFRKIKDHWYLFYDW